MNVSIFTIKKYKSVFKFATACFLVLTAAANLFAQYRGAPVQKERLIQVLRSRQLQTSDIVTIINSNGVNFRLTPEIRRSLLAAGARPEVIRAVSNNPRLPSKNDGVLAKSGNKAIRKTKPLAPAYDDLLGQAIYSYKEQKNPRGAVRFLDAAARLKPKNPEAYQMLGFVYLYGLNDFASAEKSMRESFANRGSAVFRVYHDDNGKFTHRCTGSLFISEETLRFESDNNVHTFETSSVNVDKIKLDTESTRVWKKHSVFKIFLKFGKDQAKFRFAPLTGAPEESKMVARFIAASNTQKSASNSE